MALPSFMLTFTLASTAISSIPFAPFDIAEAQSPPTASVTSPSSPTSMIDDADIKHLSSGTVLTIQRPIFIPANADKTRITPSGSGMECYLRMSRTRPYARVIPGGRKLTVTGTDRSALSAPGRIFSSTRIQVESESVDDILCSAPRNENGPKVREFRRAVSGLMRVEVPDNAVEVG